MLGFCLHLADDGEATSNLLVHHETQNAHHGGTAVVEFDGALLELLLGGEVVPRKLVAVLDAVAKVASELGLENTHVLGHVRIHDAKLHDADEGENLPKSAGGDGIRAEKGGEAVGVGVERMSLVVNGTRQMDTGTGNDVAQEGKLSDSAVLQLDVAKSLEAFLVGILKHVERIYK